MINNSRDDEVTAALMEMLELSRQYNYDSVMQAGIMFIVAMCMQGGAEVDEMDSVASAFDEAFRDNWKIAYAVRSQYVAEPGHA